MRGNLPFKLGTVLYYVGNDGNGRLIVKEFKVVRYVLTGWSLFDKMTDGECEFLLTDVGKLVFENKGDAVHSRICILRSKAIDWGMNISHFKTDDMLSYLHTLCDDENVIRHVADNVLIETGFFNMYFGEWSKR